MKGKIEIEIELFKVYSFLLVAITTGVSSILYKIFSLDTSYNNIFLSILSTLSFIMWIVILILFINSLKTIKKWKKSQK